MTSKSTSDHDRTVIRPLIVYDNTGAALWCDPEGTDDHPGMPRPTPERLHNDVVAVLTRRIAEALDARRRAILPASSDPARTPAA